MNKKINSESLMPLLLLCAIVVFYWKIANFTGVLFHFDLIGFNAPMREFFFGAIANGIFPLWCPGVCNGFPLFAEGQLGPLYPLNYLVFPFLSPGIALNVSVLLHVLLAVLGSYYYLKQTHRPESAAAGALFYGFSTYLVFHIAHLMLFQSACLIPWMYLFFDRFFSQRRWSGALGAGIILGLMLYTGHQQGPIIAAIGFGIYLIAMAVDLIADGKKRHGIMLIFAGGVVAIIAAAMATVTIYAILELLTHSVRQGKMDTSFIYSQSILPELLPRLASFEHNGRVMDNTWRIFENNEKEIAVYLGLAAWIFAPVVLVGKTWIRDRAHLVVTAFGLLFILGSAGPFAGIMEYIPVLNRMRIPPRYILIVTFSLSFLVASSLDTLASKNGLSWKKSLAACLCGAGGMGRFCMGRRVYNIRKRDIDQCGR